jgi:pimeloyl-ACP methyl ester carboxylesterase
MVMATTFTDVVEGGVAWRESGDPAGPAAVFLHGLGGRRTNWDPQLDSLSDLRRCCAVDLPGYGDSSGVPGSLPSVAAGIAAWIRTLDVGAVDVVGLSFGGMVAQHLALDHPRVVRTLVLLDTSPAFGLDGVTTPESWLATRIRAIRDPDPAAPGIEAVAAGLLGPSASDEVRTTLVESMRAVPAATLEAACRALVAHDTRARLPEVTAPTLVMVGEDDTETPPSYAETIAAGIPGAELVVVPGAGHLLNLEAPATVDSRLRRHWLGVEEAR